MRGRKADHAASDEHRDDRYEHEWHLVILSESARSGALLTIIVQQMLWDRCQPPTSGWGYHRWRLLSTRAARTPPTQTQNPPRMEIGTRRVCQDEPHA